MKDYDDVECIICFGGSLGNKLRGKEEEKRKSGHKEREKRNYI